MPNNFLEGNLARAAQRHKEAQNLGTCAEQACLFTFSFLLLAAASCTANMPNESVCTGTLITAGVALALYGASRLRNWQ